MCAGNKLNWIELVRTRASWFLSDGRTRSRFLSVSRSCNSCWSMILLIRPLLCRSNINPVLHVSGASSLSKTSEYIIQFLHAGRISLTPPRARHRTLRKCLWRKLVTLMSVCSGRNYNFRCICCFLACFCASQRVQRHKFGKSYQTAGPIGTNFGTHVQIHMGMDIGPTPNKLPLETQGWHLGF